MQRGHGDQFSTTASVVDLSGAFDEATRLDAGAHAHAVCDGKSDQCSLSNGKGIRKAKRARRFSLKALVAGGAATLAFGSLAAPALAATPSYLNVCVSVLGNVRAVPSLSR